MRPRDNCEHCRQLQASMTLPNGRPLIDELRTALRVHGKHSEMCYTVPATPKNPQGLGTCVCGLNYDLERLGA